MFELLVLISYALVVAVVVEATTELITSSKAGSILISFVARRALPNIDQPPTPKPWYWRLVYGALSCRYCFSVWAAAWALTLPGGYIGISVVDNLLAKWLLLHRLSNWIHILYELLRRGRVHTYDVTWRSMGASDESEQRVAVEP